MPWSESGIPAVALPLLIFGFPLLLGGLAGLLILPLAAGFDVRAAARRRRGGPTLWDRWPSVSIVVPAFNGEAAIEACVRSIQLTRYERWELVLVDDGSTDRTAGLMAAFAAADPRIKVVRQARSGRAAALNLGSRNSAGDVLIFVDADAAVSRRTVDRLLQGFVDERTGAVVGGDGPAERVPWRARLLSRVSRASRGVARKALSAAGLIPASRIVAMPRWVLADVGPFRQAAEDEVLALSWRVRKTGRRVGFAPRAHVYSIVA